MLSSKKTASRQRLRWALAALLGGVSSVSLAGDGFITQPKLRQARASAAATALPVAPAPTQSILVRPPAASAHAAASEGPASSEEPGANLRWVTRESRATDQLPAPNEEALRLAAPARSLPSQTLRFESSMPQVKVQPSSGPVMHPRAEQTPRSTKSEDELRREQLASLVSSQIIASGRRPVGGGASVQPVDAPPGWQAVGERLSQHIANCESLLKRNAFFSARAEAEEAMLHLVRVLDLLDNRYQSEPAWLAAQQALKEARDFNLTQRLSTDATLLQRIIESHETPVLKHADLSELAPLAAAQHYQLYAQEKIIEAAQYHSWGADVLYALGRTYQAQADNADGAGGSSDWEALRTRAATYYRTALALAPDNALAANQLGFILLQLDRPLDAREALVASIQSRPSVAALQNLVEASRRLGDNGTIAWASQNLATLQVQSPPAIAAPAVTEVDVRSFAAMSPYAAGPRPTATAASPNPANYR